MITEADLKRFAPKARREYVDALCGRNSIKRGKGSKVLNCHLIVCGSSGFLCLECPNVSFFSVDMNASAPPRPVRFRHASKRICGISPPRCIGKVLTMGRRTKIGPSIVKSVSIYVINHQMGAEDDPVHVGLPFRKLSYSVYRRSAKSRQDDLSAPNATGYKAKIASINKGNHSKCCCNECVGTTFTDARPATPTASAASVVSSQEATRANYDRCSATAPAMPVRQPLFPVTVTEPNSCQSAENLVGKIFDWHGDNNTSAMRHRHV